MEAQEHLDNIDNNEIDYKALIFSSLEEMKKILYAKTIVDSLKILFTISSNRIINYLEHVNLEIKHLEYIYQKINESRDTHFMQLSEKQSIFYITNQLKDIEKYISNTIKENNLFDNTPAYKRLPVDIYSSLNPKKNTSTIVHSIQIEDINIRVEKLEGIYNNNLEATLDEIKAIKEKFTIERNIHLEEIKEAKKSFIEEIDNYKQELNKKNEEASKLQEEQAAQIIAKLTAQLEEAKKILNLIGDTGIIGNYTKVANEHQKIANTFRWISIGIMLAMASILVYTLYLLSTTEFNIQLTITRIIIASLLTYPAIYASRESSKHRTLETKNRSLELELASLSPFIELMNEEDKLAIKKELIPKYFTGIAQENINKEKDMETMVDQIQKLSKAIAPLINKDK